MHLIHQQFRITVRQSHTQSSPTFLRNIHHQNLKSADTEILLCTQRYLQRLTVLTRYIDRIRIDRWQDLRCFHTILGRMGKHQHCCQKDCQHGQNINYLFTNFSVHFLISPLLRSSIQTLRKVHGKIHYQI